MAHQYGQFDSWKIVNEENAEKTCDKSFFVNHGSGIPEQIRWFFNAENMELGQNKPVLLHFGERLYDARINRESSELGRTLIFWPTEFARDFAAKKKKPADKLTARFVQRYEGLFVEPYLTETKLFDINQIVEMLNSLSIKNHLIQSNMVQLGEHKEEATTIHVKRDVGYILYVTEWDFSSIQAAEGIKGNIVKLDANTVNREAAEKQMEDQARLNPELIFCVTDGNKVYNNPPKYQPHCIYVYSNEAIKTVISILSNREVPEMALDNSVGIDYIGVLNYLANNQEIPYSNPDASGIDQSEKERLLAVKEKGQFAVGEMKKMAELCKDEFKLDKCLPISWLDGSNTKTRKYLLAQLKYSNYADNPISISIFVEKNGDAGARYRLSLEIKNDGTDKAILAKYHSFLDMPIDSDSGLRLVAGSNEWGNPEVLNEEPQDVKRKIAAKELRKVQLCKYIEKPDLETNEYYNGQLLEAIGQLIPYYQYVIDYQGKKIYPSLEEYDPGITAQQYENVLSDQTLVPRHWLDTVYYLYKMGGEASCKQIANQYGNVSAHYNTNAINIAKAVAKETGCELQKRKNGGTRYWSVLFLGYDMNDKDEGQYCYIMRPALKEAVSNLDEQGFFEGLGEMSNNAIEFDKNLILYGPPGTGKTYNTAKYAVSICDGTPMEQLTDYSAVMDRYNELKKERRIAFTTFHQSYGYEEFIEGIKPKMDTDSKDIGYSIEAGVFKAFCEDAKKVKVQYPDLSLIKEQPRIWGMILEKTGNSSLKKHCFEDGYIRLGWDEVKDDDVDGDFIGDETASWNGKHMVADFKNTMEPGDIVVIEKTNKSIDAIGVITGDYVYDDSAESYARSREVVWLAKDIDQDMLPYLKAKGRKQMARFSLFAFDYIGMDAISEILEKHSDMSMRVEKETKPHVFIIDEINRGNISKIFGELITLIENTKREGELEAASATLPYSGEPFSVPSNVYILGTMNTADRSIALMDTALRRRFEFIEMLPEPDVLREIGADKVRVGNDVLDVALMLEKINERITFLFDREHTIGHAFFTKLKEDPSIDTLASIFEKAIIPLLQEYFYEDYEKIQLVLGDNAKTNENHKFIKDIPAEVGKIFKGTVDDDIDIPEKKYEINHAAFKNINSYIEII